MRDARHAEVRAVLLVDESVSHGEVIKLLDLLRQGGVQHVSFGVQRADPAPPPGATPGGAGL